jgi:hypothetical protein
MEAIRITPATGQRILGRFATELALEFGSINAGLDTFRRACNAYKEYTPRQIWVALQRVCKSLEHELDELYDKQFKDVYRRIICIAGGLFGADGKGQDRPYENAASCTSKDGHGIWDVATEAVIPPKSITGEALTLIEISMEKK